MWCTRHHGSRRLRGGRSTGGADCSTTDSRGDVALRVVGLPRALPGLRHRWRDPRGTASCATHAMTARERHRSSFAPLRSSLLALAVTDLLPWDSFPRRRPAAARPLPPVPFGPSFGSRGATSEVPFRPRGFAPPRRFSPRVGRRLVASCCRSGVRRVSDPRPTHPAIAGRPSRSRSSSRRGFVPLELIPVRAPRCRGRHDRVRFAFAPVAGGGAPVPPWACSPSRPPSLRCRRANTMVIPPRVRALLESVRSGDSR